MKKALELRNLWAYRVMFEKALKDGYISEEEHALLDTISGNYGIYESSLKDALEDGIIDDDEEVRLRNLRKKIYEVALSTALNDGVITDDEKAILDHLKKSVGLDDYTLKLIEKNVSKGY
ncbi:MAG: hypothetical protein ACE5PM_07240 [Candidatus Hydrothermarchaeales archaeon]